jgi:hypothetical protein
MRAEDMDSVIRVEPARPLADQSERGAKVLEDFALVVFAVCALAGMGVLYTILSLFGVEVTVPVEWSNTRSAILGGLHILVGLVSGVWGTAAVGKALREGAAPKDALQPATHDRQNDIQ